MISAVDVKLISMQLGTARGAIADARAVSVQPPDPTAQAEVILDLSAAAQALMSTPASG